MFEVSVLIKLIARVVVCATGASLKSLLGFDSESAFRRVQLFVHQALLPGRVHSNTEIQRQIRNRPSRHVRTLLNSEQLRPYIFVPAFSFAQEIATPTLDIQLGIENVC